MNLLFTETGKSVEKAGLGDENLSSRQLYMGG